jgi:hypothetical protein
MSLDRMQSKQGFFVINPEPSYTVASSLSSIASNQMPGGLIIGSNFQLAAASAGSVGGGAPVYNVAWGQTISASSGTGAYITHDGRPIVFFSASAGGLHNLQPPTYNGQVLTIHNIANVSGSFVTGAVISGQGSGSTTTAVVQVLTNAFTFGSSGGLSASRILVGLSTYGGTASNSTYAVWSCWNV